MQDLKLLHQLFRKFDKSIIDSVIRTLHQNQINKVGLYLRSFQDKLYLAETEFDHLPSEIEPTVNLNEFAHDYSEGIFTMEKGNYHFYLFGLSKQHLNSLMVTDKFYDQINFWTATSAVLFFYNLIRQEKLKSESKNPLVYVDKKCILISGEISGFPLNINPDEIKRGSVNIDNVSYFCEPYQSPWKLPGELIYSLNRQNSSNGSKLDLYESLLQIKKYGDILSNDLDKDSVYSTEISTINRLLKRIIDDLDKNS